MLVWTYTANETHQFLKKQATEIVLKRGGVNCITPIMLLKNKQFIKYLPQKFSGPDYLLTFEQHIIPSFIWTSSTEQLPRAVYESNTALRKSQMNKKKKKKQENLLSPHLSMQIKEILISNTLKPADTCSTKAPTKMELLNEFILV